MIRPRLDFSQMIAIRHEQVGRWMQVRQRRFGRWQAQTGGRSMAAAFVAGSTSITMSSGAVQAAMVAHQVSMPSPKQRRSLSASPQKAIGS